MRRCFCNTVTSSVYPMVSQYTHNNYNHSNKTINNYYKNSCFTSMSVVLSVEFPLGGYTGGSGFTSNSPTGGSGYSLHVGGDINDEQ